MTVTLPENPFEIRKATDEKREITIGVDDAFASRSRSFMKTALLQLERIDRSQFDEGKLFKYMKETIEVDMTLLIEWARQLIKACDSLSAVGDVLDDARSSFDSMNERRHNDKNTDNP